MSTLQPNSSPVGGSSGFISYGRQSIDDSDIAAVVTVLRSDYLTQGPKVAEFEAAFAAKVGARHAVAVNSGTAALHACMAALGIGPGDEVIVPPITFTATANCAVFVGATPVFSDVCASGHIDPEQVDSRITPKTKAVIAVDYAGWPCDYSRLLDICSRRNVVLICDTCHALGASWNNKPLGSVGLLNAFSFHPVKHITTGEGGMVATDDAGLAQKLRDFRTHGLTKDVAIFRGLSDDKESSAVLHEKGSWYYEMQSIGYNYRMPDINAALGLNQLGKLEQFVNRRRAIAAFYYKGLSNLPWLQLPLSDICTPSGATHSFHLFPVLIDFAGLNKTRTMVMEELRGRGIGTQVHYIPVCLQPYYRDRYAVRPGDFPAAEQFYARELSLPIFSAMTDNDAFRVIEAVKSLGF